MDNENNEDSISTPEEAAINLTKSTIDENELFKTVNLMKEETKDEIYLKAQPIFENNSMALYTKEFDNLANKFNIDRAVLFYVYMVKNNRI